MSPNENNLIALLDEVTLFEQEHELGEAFNIFDAVGMRTQEIRHSRFLAFLLNPIATHGLGTYLLRKFLDHVMAQADTPAMTRLEVMLADLSAAEVYTERDHFDITVWLPQQKLLLVIENKISSSESLGQLSKYRERVKQQYPEEKFCGVFLTADGYDGEDSDWVSVGYAAVYDQLQVLLHDPAETVAGNVQVAIKHYSQLIRKYIVTDEKLTEACRLIYAKHRAALDLIIKHGQVSLVQEAAKRFLAGIPELQLARGDNHSRVNVVANSWKDAPSFQVADTSRWGPTCPLMLWFRLDEKRSMLNLILEVGPVREDATMNRPNLVLSLRNEFGVSANKAMSDIYTRIKRYGKTLDTDDIDSIVNTMQKLWAEFGGSNRLKRIDTIVQEIVEPDQVLG